MIIVEHMRSNAGNDYEHFAVFIGGSEEQPRQWAHTSSNLWFWNKTKGKALERDEHAHDLWCARTERKPG